MSTSRAATKLIADSASARQRAIAECLAIARLQARTSGGSKDWAACAEHIAAQIEALDGVSVTPLKIKEESNMIRQVRIDNELLGSTGEGHYDIVSEGDHGGHRVITFYCGDDSPMYATITTDSVFYLGKRTLRTDVEPMNA